MIYSRGRFKLNEFNWKELEWQNGAALPYHKSYYQNMNIIEQISALVSRKETF